MAAEITEPFTYSNGRLETVSSGAWDDDSADWAIVSNKLQWNGTGTAGDAFHQTQVSNADHYAKNTATPGNVDYAGVGVLVRGNGDPVSPTGYRVELAFYFSTHHVAVTRMDGGSTTEVADADLGASDDLAHTLRVEAEGNDIRVYVDDVLELTYTGATSYTTQRFVGLYIGRYGGDLPTIDDFEAGTSGGVAALPQKPIIVGQGAAVQRATAW